MPDFVCFDANCCVWSIKKEASAGQSENIKLAVELRKVLTKHEYKIIIPSPVLTELLIPIPPDQQSKFITEITKYFIVPDFDLACAKKLGEILHQKIIVEKKSYQQEAISKRKLKYDALIASIAIVNNAECIYTHDPDYKIFEDYIQIKKIGNLPDSLLSKGEDNSIFGKES